jgi:hypothetical protein
VQSRYSRTCEFGVIESDAASQTTLVGTDQDAQTIGVRSVQRSLFRAGPGISLIFIDGRLIGG